tara:strand:+ start:438 stop:914 length:477 start_codon:yes stop_codon:yes gene_type:complete
MIVIMDDVVDNSTFQSECIKLSESGKNIPEKWYSLDEKHIFQDFCIQMINLSSQMYDLTSCVGYEFWTHYNTIPRNWHIDKDEQLKIKTGYTRFPLCSMVYYVYVDELRGGKLHIEDDVITPKSNRLVIFSPGKYHCVEPFLGKRITLCVNPWSEKLC